MNSAGALNPLYILLFIYLMQALFFVCRQLQADEITGLYMFQLISRQGRPVGRGRAGFHGDIFTSR
jgi:hypothetical protein